MGSIRDQAKRTPRIGDVYLMRFTGVGSEQVGWRPGVVFQNNVGNKRSPNIIALPMTSSLKKLSLPTHVLIRASNSGLMRDSVVLCENPERVSKERLGQYITSLSCDDMCSVAAANLLATSAIAYLNMDRLVELRDEAARLNGLAS